MALPPASSSLNPGIHIEDDSTLVKVVIFMVAVPLALFIIQICCGRFFRRHQSEDIETGLQLQSTHLPPPPPPPSSNNSMILAESRVVTYKNLLKQETDQAKFYCTGECAICLEELEDKDRCRVLSKCKHVYHQRCIDRWLLKHANNNCPICRASVHGSGIA